MNPYERKRQHQEKLAWASSEIAKRQARGFFGSLSLVFENGVIRRIKVEESLLPPEESKTSVHGRTRQL